MSFILSGIRELTHFIFQSDMTHSDEDQTALSRIKGTIWHAALHASQSDVEALLQNEKTKNCLNERGPVGELPFHMCFLYNSPAHKQLARWMMKVQPKIITAVYEGPIYQGENVLHIAIINQDIDMVGELVSSNVELLNARATGSFFALGQACYYGESPLAFAACTSQKEIFNLLLSHGANMDFVDSNGNNMLHLLVLHNLPDMYHFVKQSWISKNPDKKEIAGEQLWTRRNNEGFTPLTLAANIGSFSMFSYLLEEQKQTQWTYGPVSCFLYPLAELDLHIAGGDESSDQQHVEGALELIVNQAHTELLMHPRMIDLVQQKWDRFAQRIFFQRFVVVLIYLVLFTYTTVLRQSVSRIHDLTDLQATQALSQEGENSEADQLAALQDSSAFFVYQYPIFLYILELAVMAGACWKAKKEVNEMLNNGLKSYFGASGSAFLENVLSASFCTCIFLVAILCILRSPLEKAVLALASITGWSYIFFFLLAFRLTGPMVVMIHQMLLNDVLRFCTIYLVFLMGFAQAFFVLFENVGLSGFIVSIKSCFIAMLGDFDLDEYASTPYRTVSIGLLVLYVVVVTILLLNLLIAMMGDTYENINEDAEKQWHLERARIIFAIENEMSVQEREDTQNKYWTTINGARFLQVLEVKDDHFQEEIEENENDEKEKNEE